MNQPLLYQGLEISYQSDLVCLDDLWQAHCAPIKQRPLIWSKEPHTQELLRNVSSNYRLVFSTTPEGVNQTWASPEIALLYAQFLGDDCYNWVKTSFALDVNTLPSEITKALNSSNQPLALSRRALVAIGWTTPIIATIALSQRAQAQISRADEDDDSGGDNDGNVNTGGGGDDSNLDSDVTNFIAEQSARCQPGVNFTDTQSFSETVNGQTSTVVVTVVCDDGVFSSTVEQIQ